MTPALVAIYSPSSHRIGILGLVPEDEGPCTKPLLVAEIILVANLIETTGSLFPLILRPKENFYILISLCIQKSSFNPESKKKITSDQKKYTCKTGIRGNSPSIIYLLSQLFFLGEQFLYFQSSHTAAASTCDGLPVSLVLNITSCEYTFYGCLRCSWDSDDVAIRIGI